MRHSAGPPVSSGVSSSSATRSRRRRGRCAARFEWAEAGRRGQSRALCSITRRVLASAAIRRSGRARRCLRRLARPGRTAATPRHRPSHHRRAARSRARTAAAAAADRLRRGRSPVLAGPGGRLLEVRPLLLSGARGASPTARVELRWDRDRVCVEHHGHITRRVLAQLSARCLAAGAAAATPSHRRSSR